MLKWLSSFLFLTLFLPGVVDANTYWVQSTGTDSGCTSSVSQPANLNQFKSSISGALGCVASAGGAPHTINVLTGTYSEYIGWNGTNVPNGTSDGARVTLQGAPGQSVTIRSPRSSANNISPLELYGFAQYITFNNMTLDCEDWVINNCMKVDQSIGINITNMTIKGAAAGNCLLFRSDGGLISNNTIFDCDFTPVTGYAYGIYLQGVGVQVDHNTIYNVSGWGVHNYLEGLIGDGGTGYPSNNTIFDNVIHDFGAGRSDSAGILLGRGTNNKAWNNVIYSGTYGISVGNCISGCTGAEVYSNTIYNMATYCLTTSGSSGAVLRNNICSNPSTYTPVSDGGSGSTFSNNLCSSDCAIGSANQTEAPSSTFNNAGAANFTLKTGSLAINNGADLGGSPYNVDFAGTSRSAPYDIGAYESGVAPTCPSVPNALVASYGFEGNATDSTLNGHTAVLGSGWSYTTGKFGQGAVSTGANGITVADHDALDMCGGFTFEGWINLPNTSGDYVFIVKNPSSANFLFASISGYCGTGRPMGGYQTTGVVAACYGSASLATGSFQHLAVTYDASLSSGNINIYLNGSLVASADGTALLTPTTGTLQFCDSGFSEVCPSGTIVDEIRVYNYARSAAEVLADSVTPIGLTAPTAPSGFKLK